MDKEKIIKLMPDIETVEEGLAKLRDGLDDHYLPWLWNSKSAAMRCHGKSGTWPESGFPNWSKP